jgi:hypothetical protein
MSIRHITICAAMLLGASAWAATSAQALTAKECSAKYQAAKTAGTLNGMKWNDFRKAQCGADATAEPAPAPAAAPAEAKPAAPPPAPAAKPAAAEPPAAGAAAKTGSPGKQAYLARLHACSADWKALKASGKRPEGQHWPQFWHECDQRKKAEGM